MSYKSILVHLDTSVRAHPRLEIALQLAHRFHATLTGLFSTYVPPRHAFFVMAGTADYYAEHERLRHERASALERLFRAELARANVDGHWIAANGYANDVVPPYARLADLIVLGQTDPTDPEAFVAEQFVEHVVLSVGRPVLLVPSGGTFAAPGRHVLVAWDGSREATRAIHDALPFLAHAAKVTLLTVHSSADRPPRDTVPGDDIALTVARHGVKIDVRELSVADDTPVGDALLSQAADLGCDMIVMGAYAHSRLHEVVLGGATRTMLESMTVPVLLSH
ncbi:MULTISPECIES: universal stress protein [unclassified Paraburkholderia]|uniref:universal stress protein n=1 Tax=unclassified Paraburkholderia TaxID=2615204 RepID=UPI0016148C8A|nr:MULTISPECIES: universal stress protein [unclassified Paraburkholderia]MBB5444961.1 nucleotide-binding universal stress UspA family protein [Paraburkholderia sp. WSM4177]MBB5483892.1 nucleotide-binding universal stress UspA family protein [Paraburkholderia sp. WSM4180]